MPGSERGGAFVPEPVLTREPCTLAPDEVAGVVELARAGVQPDNVDELAAHAVALTLASREVPEPVADGPNPSDMQAIAVGLHQYAHSFLPQYESVTSRAMRLLSVIVERGTPVDLDHPDLPIFLDFVLGRFADLDNGRGVFAHWARDTTVDLHRCISAAFTHENTDAGRFYRARMGIPQRLRIDGKDDRRAWTAAFASFVRSPHATIDAFTMEVEHTWWWPCADELIGPGGRDDDDQAWNWAHNCWFRALGDDACEARPGLEADRARLARSVEAFRQRAGLPTGEEAAALPSLESLAAEFHAPWGKVVAAVEDLLRAVLPDKYEQIVALRHVTVQRRALIPPAVTQGSQRGAPSDDPADRVVDVEREVMITDLAEALAAEPPPSGNDVTISVDEFAEQLIDLGGRLPEPDLVQAARDLGSTVDELQQWWEHVRRCVEAVDRRPGGDLP